MRRPDDGRDAKSWCPALVTGRETAIYRSFTAEEMRVIEGSVKPARLGAIEALELWRRGR